MPTPRPTWTKIVSSATTTNHHIARDRNGSSQLAARTQTPARPLEMMTNQANDSWMSRSTSDPSGVVDGGGPRRRCGALLRRGAGRDDRLVGPHLAVDADGPGLALAATGVPARMASGMTTGVAAGAGGLAP